MSKAMNQTQLTALHASIDHWLENYNKVLAKREPDLGTDYCPLCKEFHYWNHQSMSREESCQLCPIAQHTGKKFCGGTPYSDVEDSLEDPDLNWSNVLESVKAEYDFLISLVPTKSTSK